MKPDQPLTTDADAWIDANFRNNRLKHREEHLAHVDDDDWECGSDQCACVEHFKDGKRESAAELARLEAELRTRTEERNDERRIGIRAECDMAMWKKSAEAKQASVTKLDAELADTKRVLVGAYEETATWLNKAHEECRRREAIEAMQWPSEADAVLGQAVREMRERIDKWLVTDGTNGCIEIIQEIFEAIDASQTPGDAT